MNDSYLRTATYSCFTFGDWRVPQAVLYQDLYVGVQPSELVRSACFAARTSAFYSKARRAQKATDDIVCGKLGECAVSAWLGKAFGVSPPPVDFQVYEVSDKSFDADLRDATLPEIHVKTALACTDSWTFQYSSGDPSLSGGRDTLFDRIRKERVCAGGVVRGTVPLEHDALVALVVAPDESPRLAKDLARLLASRNSHRARALAREILDGEGASFLIRGLVTWKFLVEEGLLHPPRRDALVDLKKCVYLHDGFRGLEYKIQRMNDEGVL